MPDHRKSIKIVFILLLIVLWGALLYLLALNDEKGPQSTWIVIIAFFGGIFTAVVCVKKISKSDTLVSRGDGLVMTSQTSVYSQGGECDACALDFHESDVITSSCKHHFHVNCFDSFQELHKATGFVHCPKCYKFITRATRTDYTGAITDTALSVIDEELSEVF